MRACTFAAVAPRPLPTFQALYSLVPPMLPLPLQCSSSRPWIRPADRPGSRVWGKMRVRAAWQVVVAMVLVWGWGVEAQLSGGEAAAMQVLRDKLRIGADAWQPEEDPCGLWRGVMCLNGHVDAVLLTGLPRTGGDPSLGDAWALSQLPFLRVFNASQFTFTGGIPGWFGNVVSLESLDLTGCSLSGALPENFGALSRLKTLSLAGNKLSGTVPASFGNFSGLAFLNLSMNAFVGAVPALSSGVLTVVDLSWNKLSEGVGPLLSGVPNLEFLDLSRNRLTLPVPWELGNLMNLHYLDMSRNDISGSLPPELGRLANLTVARFSYNNFSGALPAELTGWSGCRVMELDHNEFSGDIPATIGLLQNLVVLDVSQNNFKGVYSRGLLSLPMLQVLNLSGNLFYGPLPQELAAHQALATLDISENFFNGTVPMGFLPTAITRKNCLAQVDKQRPLRVCTKFYAPMGVTFSFNATPPIDNTNAAAPPPPYSTSPLENPRAEQSSTGSNLAPLLAGVFGGMALILFVGVMVFCLHRCQMRRSRDRAMDSGRVSAVGGRGQTFTYSQLASATSKFSLSNLICVGHSGDLYRGEMSGTAVVVKKVDLRRVKRDLYLSELEVFDKASHTKLVSLLGTCLDREEEKYLVYKYCPNNDLASSLHKKGSSVHSDDVLQSLDWITRLKIAIGVADGLSYLHSECSPPIIHRDVRASSILLDDKYEVRIGSLGDASIQDSDSHPNILSRMFGLSSSSYDPADPSHGIATSTYDVYCFGKVLLELVSGKLGISGTTNNQWLDWALPLINVNDKEGLPKIIDPSLIVDEDLMEEVWAMAIIAKACLNSKPSKRPSMKHVLKALENPHKVVREENFGESLAVRSSSRSSWNEVLFGSFRHHNSVSGYFRGGGAGGSNNNNGNSSGNEDNYPASMPIARPGMLASSSSQNSREMYAMNHHIRHGSCDIAREPIVEVAHESDDDQLRR